MTLHIQAFGASYATATSAAYPVHSSCRITSLLADVHTIRHQPAVLQAWTNASSAVLAQRQISLSHKTRRRDDTCSTVVQLRLQKSTHTCWPAALRHTQGTRASAPAAAFTFTSPA